MKAGTEKRSYCGKVIWSVCLNREMCSAETAQMHKQRKLMVGTRGFEPPTPSPPAKCATKLRYVPTLRLIIMLLAVIATSLMSCSR